MSQPTLMDIGRLSQLLGRTAPDNVSIFGRPPERREREKTRLVTEPEIFTIHDRILNITAPENEKDYVHSICERAGLFRQQMEYFPSSHNRLQVMTQQSGVKFDDIGNPGWPRWFIELIKGKLVIPDTNILMNHTLSVHILPRVSPLLRLSRISILELEALANKERKYVNP